MNNNKLDNFDGFSRATTAKIFSFCIMLCSHLQALIIPEHFSGKDQQALNRVYI